MLVAAAGAAAGPPGKWTPLSKGAVTPTDQAGLVRTPDGTLHVSWQRRGILATALWRTRIAADGRTIGSEPIAGGLMDAGSPALTIAPDGGLRAFFFVRTPDAAQPALLLATAPAAGGWTVAHDPLAQAVGPAVPAVGAATARDGTPVVAWPVGTQVRYRFGVDPGADSVPLGVGGCCSSAVQPAVDQVTGRVYVAWASSAAGATGIFVQTVDRSGPVRPKVFATGSATRRRDAAVLPDGHVALAARTGVSGVYLAYTSGFPRVKAIVLLRAGVRKVVVRLNAPGASHVVLAPAPQGRLWLAWSRGGTIFAARSNRAATKLGVVREIPIRRGARAVDQLQGDGSAGPLDLVASLESRAGAAAFWHQQVQPGLSLTVAVTTPKTGPARYVFRVADAGEPVANASIKVGNQVLTTGLAGTVVLVTGDRPATATATKLGYAPATATIP
jgi:hypothetical protein